MTAIQKSPRSQAAQYTDRAETLSQMAAIRREAAVDTSLPSATIWPRQILNEEQRRRYFENISSHRPFELELLRWNHDASDEEGASAYRQLHCLVGRYRQVRDEQIGGGIRWTPLELAGVFLRHRFGGALVWLPEAGANCLVQASPRGSWFLLEAALMEKRRVVVDKTTQKRNGEVVSAETEAAFLVQLHETARIREADPHLTDKWLQAAVDLQELWTWDWQPLRKDSAFELSFPKFVYTVRYPISDVLHGFHGEERWRWHWKEDGAGSLFITNQAWRSDVATLCLSREEVRYHNAHDEQISFGPLCAWWPSQNQELSELQTQTLVAPAKKRHIIFLSGAPGAGKTALAERFRNNHGFVHFDADCWMVGFDPISYAGYSVTPDTLGTICDRSLEKASWQLAMMREFNELRAGCRPDGLDLEPFYAAMANDIRRVRIEHPERDVVVSHAVWSRASRDLLRRQLGKDLFFFVLLLPQDVAKLRKLEHMREEAGRVGRTLGAMVWAYPWDDMSYEQRMERLTFAPATLQADQDEPNAFNIETTADHTVSEVLAVIVSRMDFTPASGASDVINIG